LAKRIAEAARNALPLYTIEALANAISTSGLAKLEEKLAKFRDASVQALEVIAELEARLAAAEEHASKHIESELKALSERDEARATAESAAQILDEMSSADGSGHKDMAREIRRRLATEGEKDG
jgi:pyrroloquinoline quinone (PQQ) biosynthesis protein C